MGLINLQKGQLLDLSKYDGLRKVRVGLGWDMANEDEPKADLDLSFFAFRNGKMQSPQDLVFFNNRFGVNGIQGSVDNRDGAGEGDDEVGIIELDKLSPDIDKILITASIFEPDKNGQTFKSIRNAKIRLVNDETKEELTRLLLTEDASTSVIVEFAILEKVNGEWSFKNLSNCLTLTADGKVETLETVLMKYM